MIRPSPDIPVVRLCREPIDMHRSIDGPAAWMSHVLQGDPFSAKLCVFVNRRAKQTVPWFSSASHYDIERIAAGSGDRT